jgi:CDGSH-type Zn-finger protein
MPRIVRFEATGPIRIDPQDKPVFVCACGLSANFPFCDGKHKICKDEDPAKVYRYNPETGEAVEDAPGDGSN